MKIYHEHVLYRVALKQFEKQHENVKNLNLQMFDQMFLYHFHVELFLILDRHCRQLFLLNQQFVPAVCHPLIHVIFVYPQEDQKPLKKFNLIF